MPSPRLLTALLSALLLSSCSTYRDTVAIHISSDPPGADVVVDGVPTGYATPCMVALPKHRQVISIEKEGFQIPRRILFPDPYNDTWLYSEATVGPHTFDFLTFISLDDFLEPVVTKNELIPARIFVRLKRLTDLGSEQVIEADPELATDDEFPGSE
ncbi:MAG: hypothetical protein ACI9F9_000978 [Candidatus Paceibacteria bacterium]|jgi:hypothetical protein